MNAIDYFVTLGVAGHLKIEQSSGNENFTPSSCDLWENAITDIVILNEGRFWIFSLFLMYR